MGKKLYVGNLSYSTSEEQLRTLFEQVGEVTSVTVITDRETGRSKGFGFVELATEEASAEAIRRFSGYTFENRNLTVNEAHPREQRTGGGSSSYGGGSSYGGSSSGGGSYGGGSGSRNRNSGGGGGNRNRY